MWFIISKHVPARFYNEHKEAVSVPEIELTNEVEVKIGEQHSRHWSSQPFIKDHTQALRALSEKGIQGFKTKLEAKAFSKTLKEGTYKYLRLNSIEKYIASLNRK